MSELVSVAGYKCRTDFRYEQLLPHSAPDSTASTSHCSHGQDVQIECQEERKDCIAKGDGKNLLLRTTPKCQLCPLGLHMHGSDARTFTQLSKVGLSPLDDV